MITTKSRTQSNFQRFSSLYVLLAASVALLMYSNLFLSIYLTQKISDLQGEILKPEPSAQNNILIETKRIEFVLTFLMGVSLFAGIMYGRRLRVYMEAADLQQKLSPQAKEIPQAMPTENRWHTGNTGEMNVYSSQVFTVAK
jgi:hypothetical protein